MKDYLLIGFILIMFILYVVILPVVRQRKLKKQQIQRSEFQKSLCINDRVMLAAGIIGSIQSIHQETIELKIACNTVIYVDRLAIVGRIMEK